MLTSIPAASMHRYLRAISGTCKIVENSCGQIARAGRYFGYVKQADDAADGGHSDRDVCEARSHQRRRSRQADVDPRRGRRRSDHRLCQGQIKFVSRLAHNRAIRRGLEVR